MCFKLLRCFTVLRRRSFVVHIAVSAVRPCAQSPVSAEEATSEDGFRTFEASVTERGVSWNLTWA